MVKNLFILGDSYSTYEGFIPDGYRFYYSWQGRPGNPVTNMLCNQTWWKRFIDKTGASLVQNNSWSGSTICYTGREGQDCSKTNSFIYRYKQLYESGFFEKNKIDTFIIFGATNDNWGVSPLGEPKYSGWTEQDLYNSLPAISYLCNRVKNDLPNAKLIYIINTDLRKQIVDVIKESACRYGFKALELEKFEKVNGHPTAFGMESICNQLIDFIDKIYN